MYNPLKIVPGYSNAVAAIVRMYDSLALRKPRAKDRIVKQRQRAVYFQRYPFGQKQKAKVLAQNLRNGRMPYGIGYDELHYSYQRLGALHVMRSKGRYNWRNFLDLVSKPD